jgi:hypothetical protein
VARVRVKGGWRAIEQLLEDYKSRIYKYNSTISKTGFYLKPVHVVVKSTSAGKRKYIYIGRYWWKISYVGRQGKTSRIRWVYVGTEKPRELIGYPDPPPHPLVGLSLAVEGDDVILDESMYRRFSWLFKGYQVVVEK